MFADSLAGTPLAIAVDAPVLLTDPAALHPATDAELLRAAADDATVYVLGGTAALSQPVADRIGELGLRVMRYGGATGSRLQRPSPTQGSRHPPHCCSPMATTSLTPCRLARPPVRPAQRCC